MSLDYKQSKLNQLRRWILSVWFLCALALVAYVGLTIFHYTQFETFEWRNLYHITSPFLIGILVSAIFYYLVIYIPVRRKHLMLKDSFSDLYCAIKEDIIMEILECVEGVASSELVEKLSSISGYREFFSEENGRDRHYKLHNVLQTDTERFQRFLRKIQRLAEQIEFLLHNYEIKNQKHFRHLKHLEALCLDINELDIEVFGDDLKTLVNFLHDLLGGLTTTAEPRDYDVIEKILEEI